MTMILLLEDRLSITYPDMAALVLVRIATVNDDGLLDHMVILSSQNLCQLQKESNQ